MPPTGDLDERAGAGTTRLASARRGQPAAAALAAAGIFPGQDELLTLDMLFMFARRKTEVIYSLPLDYDT